MADPGRARGRARGRGRADELPQPVRRPGESSAPPPVGASSQASSARPSSSHGVWGGRATQRGGTQLPQPGPSSYAGSSSSPTQSMGELSLTGPTKGVGRGASRGREARNEIIFTRPSREFDKRGRAGNPVSIMANFFEITSRPDWHLLQYRVDFSPDIDHMGVRKALVRMHENVIGKFVFDGTLLYAVRRLPKDPTTLFSKRQSDDSVVNITIKLVGEIHKEDATYISVMSIILRRCIGMLNLTLINRNFYDSEAAENIPNHNLTIWPGYVTTIRQYENSLLLGVEVSHKVLRRDTALDVMNRAHQSGGNIQQNIKAELEGKIIMTTYNKKTYRIDDIDFGKNPQHTFLLRKENKQVSYIEYYRTRYNINIRNSTQPMLVSRPSRRDINRGDTEPIYLIPETCVMTGLTDEMRNNRGLMTDVARFTRLTPDRRVDSLLRFNRRLNDVAQIQAELNSWGLKFSRELVRCNARVLNPEQILQSAQYSYPPHKPDWGSELRKHSMSVSPILQNWLVVFPERMHGEVMSFCSMLSTVGRQHGFIMPAARMSSMRSDRTRDYVECLREEIAAGDYNIVLIVMRSQRADTYSAIKKLTCVDMPVPSQVVTGRVITKGLPVASKVMIQMACKMGGEPWKLLVPNQSWMVIGYDTYHDAKQRRAVGGFVASINNTFTRYVSAVSIHENNEEISSAFGMHFAKALRAFHKQNGSLPSRIIFYRDGVGAGDINRVKDTELRALKSACREGSKLTGQDYKPGIAFIIVSKRINTRLFQMGRVINNPLPGTVVDNTVTQFERYDFFLVSQSVNQGTVSPTSYNVIEDTTGLTPDHHQRLAYILTHLYYNWPGTLRVPAPCQYAHKLAYLVGESIMQQPHEALANYPYYL